MYPLDVEYFLLLLLLVDGLPKVSSTYPQLSSRGLVLVGIGIEEIGGLNDSGGLRWYTGASMSISLPEMKQRKYVKKKRQIHS